MNPDRIIVGECRGGEAMAMLWALATGHAGMTSVHGETCEHALRNLARFALTSGHRIEQAQALDWLREIDVLVHCDRPRSYTEAERRFLPRAIDEIVEVAGVEGSRMTLNPLSALQQAARSAVRANNRVSDYVLWSNDKAAPPHPTRAERRMASSLLRNPG